MGSTLREGAAPDVVKGGAAAGSTSEERSLVGELLAGRYRIDKELGQGGMGAVYLAEHVHMRKVVAVKVLHREMTYLPEVVARFEREAVAAARIEHPHVAAATDFGRLEDGAFYLVLEYVEGKSLRQLLDEGGPLRPDIAVHVAGQIADALSAAHAAGIVHRDLKPDNVMLIQRDSDAYFVKVLDFGIAKVELGDAQSQLTQMGSVFGTPEYMAPEQAAGTPVDARADLYTLGVILYEMLTGRTPFADDDMVVVLTRQMTADPPLLPPEIDPNVASLVMQLLAKDPDQRPQTAAEVLARVEACVAVAIGSSPLSAMAPVTPSPTSASVATSAQSGDVAYGETVLSLSGEDMARLSAAKAEAVAKRPSPISQLLGPLFAKAPVLKKPVNLGGQPVPLWALAGVGVALTGFLFFVVFGLLVASGVSASGSSPAASGSARTAAVPRDDTDVLIQRASAGDREAISKLQERPDSGRSAAEWKALARGHSVVGNVKPSLGAYKKALALEPALAKEPELLRDVRRAALSSATTGEALELALAHLGSRGADLAYDVWSSTRGNKDQAEVTRIAKGVLDGPAIRAKASPALLVALDLSKAKTCPNLKELLPRAKQSADARSLGKLKSLSGRSGCGFLGLGDCFACLRTGTGLAEATKAAESRPAPSFE
ncbi:MAG: serine/threonine protein kinase [Polyangiaceae bacterium]|nr:serine/threonine protein kinase [Polyangiaceae bacterium]MCE7891284.1 serine/threonine protein kinase [Sorangiineae bacterium PRO1]MCL4751008.1 serine/threonine protein kinase [Myxococcales bacterium]